MAKRKFYDPETPLYEITMEEDGQTGIRLVSLVIDPAIEEKGMYFSKEEIQDFKFKSVEDKQMVVGPAMIPNKKIIRKDEDGNPYFVFFSVNTIRMLVEKFNSQNNNKSINIDHTNTMVDGYIQQSWIVSDPVYDKSKYYGYDLPVGSWFIEVKINDSKFFKEKVKNEGRYSFSIEGLLGQKLVNYSEQDFSSFIDNLSDEDIICLMKELLPSGEFHKELQTERISFDFDKTLERLDVQAIAKKKL